MFSTGVVSPEKFESSAIRQTGESERSEYRVLQIKGDATVTQEVIARYLALQEQSEDLPLSSVAITPANYTFRYMGEVGTGDTSAYVFRINPRKNVMASFDANSG